MFPDPRWVNALTDNIILIVGVPPTCIGLLLIRRFGWLPPLPWWAVLLIWATLFFFGSLLALLLVIGWVDRRAARRGRQ